MSDDTYSIYNETNPLRMSDIEEAIEKVEKIMKDSIIKPGDVVFGSPRTCQVFKNRQYGINMSPYLPDGILVVISKNKLLQEDVQIIEVREEGKKDETSQD